MNDQAKDQLRELNWRRPLTEAEQAQLRGWLETDREERADWEAEARLTEGLSQLSDAPLPSNFTARVLEAVERDAAASSRRRRRARISSWLRWAPRIAFAGLVGAAGFFSYQRFHEARVRADVRASVEVVSSVPSMPGPEILENFEAIRVFSSSAADEKLLTLLQ